MKIIVDSEELKQRIIEESKYVHDFCVKIRGRKKRVIKWKELDSDKAYILMHIYNSVEIEVQ